MQQCRLGLVAEKCLCCKGSLDLVDKKLNVSQQCALVLKKVNILGCIYRNIASKLREVIISLSSALVSSYLEYCALYFGSPIHKRH